MSWDDFITGWRAVGIQYAWHEHYRSLGLKVSFNERGTTIVRAGSVLYSDSI